MIKVYTTETCSNCVMAKKYLSIKGVEYQTVDVTNSPELRQMLYEKTGVMRVPVISRDDKDFVVGFQAGLLAKLIA